MKNVILHLKKKIIMRYVLLFMSLLAIGQVRVPAPSPNSIVKETVGLTSIELDYNRPSARGRVIFGDLVPFGRLWRTGANKNSMITFSDKVKIEGKELPKGTYAVFATPKANDWDVVFYTDTENWGVPQNFDQAKVALQTTVKTMQLPNHVETFTMALSNFTNDSALINIMWEKTGVALKVEVPTKDIALNNIKKALAGPSAADYFAAAQYFFSAELDINEALTMINKAAELTANNAKGTPFWYLRLKSLIQHKAGDKKGAIETAKLSLAASEEANNADYIKMNKDSIAEWSKR